MADHITSIAESMDPGKKRSNRKVLVKALDQLGGFFYAVLRGFVI